jgi:thymidylate synthase (FAD)
MSFGDRQSTMSNRDYVEQLIAKGHGSVLEHVAWTFIVTGVTRSFTHQLVRHRIGFSFSQLSQQYQEQDFYEFIEPPVLERNDNLKAEWEKAIQASHSAYCNIKKILEVYYSAELQQKDRHNRREIRRLILSTARSVLPNCIETKIVFSANGRSLRHFLKLRGALVGDLEMRFFLF